MKKFLSVLLMVSVIITGCSVSKEVLASSDVVVSLQIGNSQMSINGKPVPIDEGRETKPVVIGGRTLVPIRAIIEAFGGNVGWIENSRTVVLKLNDDTIKLGIDNRTAYLNDTKYTLDTAPAIIDERTMLPIRFVAESFNIGVAWDDETKKVWLIQNTFDDKEQEKLSEIIPAYDGRPYVSLNNDVPFFEDYEIISSSFEFYGNLDDLGRCDVAMASVGVDIMPTEKRGDISSVKPTGWINVPYDNVDGRYLYNRCHLIGFQLTGENANKRNLITGTRYMNVEGMLPFENDIDDYVEDTGNNVIYRVTPVFTGDNLVADGVLLEAYSVEDKGKGICFCVYCYNVQPGIFIDYATGRSNLQ